MNQKLLEELLSKARGVLIDACTPKGFWIGELSTSALSTATAVFTLSLYQQRTKTQPYDRLIRDGLSWLATNVNADGGWGDTTKSFSNLSTTCLCWSAFAIPEAREFATVSRRAEEWIVNHAKSLEPARLRWSIESRYGVDRTFSVPILTMLALAGRLGEQPWRWIPQLPFELAALPFWCFQTVRLPVVSYALPALIAIGFVRHHHHPTWNPFTNPLRWWFKSRVLRKLRAIQPTTGGYLEATPLTSFVCMSLVGAGQVDHPVVREGLEFLVKSVRPDGSWPIDTNLSTWVTTLAINALGPAYRPTESIKSWLIDQQYRTVHPYTQAKPGGWAWTNLSGGVPDADDTPSALLALHRLDPDSTTDSAEAGIGWLLDLQNNDGGIPTFCKGWGALPFDRSSNDLTAHALRAWQTWRSRVAGKIQQRIDRGTERGVEFLLRQQRPEGSWAPLWFGNQHSEEVANLTYGTSRVMLVGEDQSRKGWNHALRKAENWLINSQNTDGGWGGRTGTPSSIEETALALEALATRSRIPDECIDRGLVFLNQATNHGTDFPPSPIGFYFANLWYYEKLYPVIYTVAALTRLAQVNDKA